MFNLHVIVINYGKPVAHLNMCYSLIAIKLNGSSFVGRVVENQRQCLISIVIMRLSNKLSMCLISLIATEVSCMSLVPMAVYNQRKLIISESFRSIHWLIKEIFDFDYN